MNDLIETHLHFQITSTYENLNWHIIFSKCFLAGLKTLKTPLFLVPLVIRPNVILTSDVLNRRTHVA